MGVIIRVFFFINGSKNFRVFPYVFPLLLIDTHHISPSINGLLIGFSSEFKNSKVAHLFSARVQVSTNGGACALDFSNSAQFKLNFWISTDGICSPDSDSGPAARVLILISHSPLFFFVFCDSFISFSALDAFPLFIFTRLSRFSCRQNWIGKGEERSNEEKPKNEHTKRGKTRRSNAKIRCRNRKGLAAGLFEG